MRFLNSYVGYVILFYNYLCHFFTIQLPRYLPSRINNPLYSSHSDFLLFFYDNNCFRLNRRLRKYCLLSCVRDVFSECIFTLAIASVLQSIGYWAFFPGNNFVHRTHWTHLTGGTLFHNELKICSAPCRLSLVLMNTPGTAKVLGSNLTKTSFFSKGNCSGSKKFPPNIYLLVLLA